MKVYIKMDILGRHILSLLFLLVCVMAYPCRDLDKYSWKKIATGMPDKWYASEQAAEIAENVLYYQTKAGGWTKNTDFHKSSDSHNCTYIYKSDSHNCTYIYKSDSHNSTGSNECAGFKGCIDAEEWSRVVSTGIGATFDNGATVTEMRFLARMYRHRKDKRYREAFLKAFGYILDAQYDNGGWPQYYPVRKGKSVSYSGCITFNDNAYINVMNILRDIFTGSVELAPFELDDTTRIKARRSFDKGIRCILDTQIRIGGERTVWCAQHDPCTLEPAKARAYELPSFCGGESAGIVLLLMSIPEPSEEIISSVKGAVRWFQENVISDMRYERFRDAGGEKDSRLVPSPGSTVWARFYDLETGKPFFCDRDGIKKSGLGDIGKERRGGYSWYVSSPSEVLEQYPGWLKNNGL